MGRTGLVSIIDPKTKKVLIDNHVPYGAILSVKNGAKVEKVSRSKWDPYNAVILSEFDGTVTLMLLKKVLLIKRNTMSKLVTEKK